MEIPAGAVTAKDLYDELSGLRRDLTRLLTHMERVDTRNETADRLHTDHESRLRALERWRYALPTSLIVAFGSGALTLMELVTSRH